MQADCVYYVSMIVVTKSDNSFGLFNRNASVCDVYIRPFQPR